MGLARTLDPPYQSGGLTSGNGGGRGFLQGLPSRGRGGRGSPVGLARTLDPPYQSGGLTSGNGGGRGFPVGLARTLDPPYESSEAAAYAVRRSCDTGPNGMAGRRSSIISGSFHSARTCAGTMRSTSRRDQREAACPQQPRSSIRSSTASRTARRPATSRSSAPPMPRIRCGSGPPRSISPLTARR